MPWVAESLLASQGGLPERTFMSVLFNDAVNC
jgi:hypothetical protein